MPQQSMMTMAGMSQLADDPPALPGAKSKVGSASSAKAIPMAPSRPVRSPISAKDMAMVTTGESEITGKIR